MVVRSVLLFAVSAFINSSLAFAQDADVAEQLKRDVGEWTVVIKMFGDPDGAPVVSKGTETRFMLGDMWLISRFKGEFLGTSFEGLRQTGFDPEKRTYVASWVDSMSHYPTHSVGTWDKQAQTMTSMGTGKDPSGNVMKTKFVAKYHEDGSQTSTMYVIVNGQETKMMEFHYTKVEEKRDVGN
jgi:hypothetical protein